MKKEVNAERVGDQDRTNSIYLQDLLISFTSQQSHTPLQTMMTMISLMHRYLALTYLGHDFNKKIYIKDDVLASKSQGEKDCEITVSVLTETPVSPLTPSDVDWDALYEEDEEESEVDMKSHGSVITHLLSQVMIKWKYTDSLAQLTKLICSLCSMPHVSYPTFCRKY